MTPIRLLFQSTLPRGERHKRQSLISRHRNFNPRSREGSDGGVGLAGITTTKDFNPRSREGSDLFASVIELPVAISIHAPARGATFRNAHHLYILHDFNPRSREGSDLSIQCSSCVWEYFNPRSREGSDVAPPATDCNTDPFQSTLPRGERHIELQCNTALWKFQSTLPRGERLPFLLLRTSRLVFQSTLPRGERQQPQADEFRASYISIHAPARGATIWGQF